MWHHQYGRTGESSFHSPQGNTSLCNYPQTRIDFVGATKSLAESFQHTGGAKNLRVETLKSKKSNFILLISPFLKVPHLCAKRGPLDPQFLSWGKVRAKWEPELPSLVECCLRVSHHLAPPRIPRGSTWLNNPMVARSREKKWTLTATGMQFSTASHRYS